MLLAFPLVYRGSKADEIDEESRTPLHLAAEYGREEVMKVLLESVHILSFRDAQGKTVLHMAAERNHVGIVEVITTTTS
ncbi:unnamed protein product [Protopolystoma xenopodis]|uniref:Uncharacterized protein n=1 Tax=Protopolystoma xenopodis TaxID=117903 RepID=A0A448XLV8_9PLAT|nr:unnamed protein product [Protopolystoma xenopodis]